MSKNSVTMAITPCNTNGIITYFNNINHYDHIAIDTVLQKIPSINHSVSFVNFYFIIQNKLTKGWAINALTNLLISHKTNGFPINNGFKNSILANKNLAKLNRV